jgi:PAS domain S-box-containing protein
MWDRYRNWIEGGVSALVIQAILIGTLVANQRKRRKAERSLRETDERMQLAAKAAEMCLWELDLVTDRVWVAGPLAARLGHQDRATKDYNQLHQGIHPDDQNRVAAALIKARLGEGSFESVHRRVLPDGKIIWVAARGRVEFDPARRPLRMRGISMDITGRKEAEDQARKAEAEAERSEQQSRKSEERMKLAADAAGLRLWEWDVPADRVWVTGPLIERIGPTDRERAQFTDLFEAVHPDDQESVTEL